MRWRACVPIELHRVEAPDFARQFRNFGGDCGTEVYGVPADLNLTPFHGAALEQIALGEYIVQFRFGGNPCREIGVEGGWELRAADGSLVDRNQDTTEREAYRVHLLLGRTVLASEVRAPKSFTLKFDSGHTLEIFDDQTEYESFSIQPGDVFV
jgi:hypothetical protein